MELLNEALGIRRGLKEPAALAVSVGSTDHILVLTINLDIIVDGGHSGDLGLRALAPINLHDVDM
jgi:hypothetical protein